jgi:beta-lactamase regulating signal transducer with metallopeptidase domain
VIVTSWLLTYLVHSTTAYGVVWLLRPYIREASTAEVFWKSAAFLPVATTTVARAFDIGFWTIDLRPIEPLGSSLALARLSTAPLTGPNSVEFFTRVLVIAGGFWFCRELGRRALFVRRLGIRQAADGSLAAIFVATRQLAGMSREVRVTISEALTSPIALGRREICVPPQSATALDARELEALFAHEFAHLRRRDEWQAWRMSILQCVLFVQPLHRIAGRELQHLAETACDAWAAALLTDAEAMASCLVEVASWQRVRPHAGILSIIGSNGLSDRVARLLSPELRRPISQRTRVAAYLAMSGVLLTSPALRLPQSWTEDFLAGYAAGLSAPVEPLQDNFQMGKQMAEAFLATHGGRRSQSIQAPGR